MERRVVLPALSRPSRRMEYSNGGAFSCKEEGKGKSRRENEDGLIALCGRIGGDVPSLDVAQKYTLLARWYILAGRDGL